jgi:hypothetical protein
MVLLLFWERFLKKFVFLPDFFKETYIMYRPHNFQQKNSPNIENKKTIKENIKGGGGYNIKF